MNSKMKVEDLKSGMIFQPRGQFSLYMIISFSHSAEEEGPSNWVVAWLNRAQRGPGLELAYTTGLPRMGSDELIGWIGQDPLVGYWDRQVSTHLINELTKPMEL